MVKYLLRSQHGPIVQRRWKAKQPHRFPVTDSLEFCHLVFANRLQNSPLSLSLPHKLVIQLFFLNPEIDLTDVEKKDGKGSNLSLVGHCQKW